MDIYCGGRIAFEIYSSYKTSECVLTAVWV